MARVVTLGELLVEFVAIEGDGFPTPLPTGPGRFAGPFPSGAPAIFIDQAARMGLETAILGSVGADSFGGVLLERLLADGVDTRLVRRLDHLPTGTAHVGYNADGSRDFVFHIAGSAADAVSADDARALVNGADAVHLSGASFGSPRLREAALVALEAADQAGTRVSMDPNIRPELMGDPAVLAEIRRALDRATWIFPSEEDLRFLAPDRDPIDAARSLLREGKTIVITRGEQGAALIDTDGLIDRGAYAVEPIDPTGAGDAFAATFLAAHLSGADSTTALECAVKAGALATTRLGPMEGNTTIEDIGLPG